MILLTLRLGEPLSFTKISNACGISSLSEVRSILHGQLKEHYKMFGTDPFIIKYDRKIDDYLLIANSTIGRLDCNKFILEITSKFNEIELGKWLHVAHHSGALNLVRHNNKISESKVDGKDTLNGVDYFALALISATYDCIDQGLLYERAVFNGEDPNFRGKLQVSDHVKNGGNPTRIQTSQISKNFSCPPNIIIKRALEMSVNEVSNTKLKGLAATTLASLSAVNTSNFDTALIQNEIVSSIPRPDYEKAIALSKLILQGFTSTDGLTESFTPFFTLDLDVLFERFVTFDLKKTLKSKYKISAQPKLPHPIQPTLDNNYISPDIIVELDDGSSNSKIILDTKNKYSVLEDEGTPKISNQDLFQMAYYCQAINCKTAILVYPGYNKNFTKYPLRGSEGESTYVSKRDLAIKRLFELNNSAFHLDIGIHGIDIILWRVNLSGTLQNTRESIAQLSQFVADYLNKQVLN